MFHRSLAVVLAVLSLTACSSVEEGASCDDATKGSCDSESAALICDRGTYRLFQCRGTGGCITDTSRNEVLCNFGTFRAGDTCPSSIENGFQCDPANANQALQCTGGTMKVVACKSCTLAGDKITCQQ